MVLQIAPQATHVSAHPPVTPAVAGAAEATISQQHIRPTAEDHAMNALQTVSRWGSSLWAIGWVTVPVLHVPMPVFAWAGSLAGMLGMKSFESAITMAIEGTTHGINHVKLKDIHQLPGQILRNASDIAGESKGKYAQGWVQPVANAANVVDARMNSLAAGISNATQPMRIAVSKGVDRFGQSGLGKGISNGMQGIAKRRRDVNLTKQAKHLADAKASFTKQPRGPIEWLLKRPAKEIPMPAAFSEALSHANSGHAEGLQKAMESLDKIATSDKELGGQAASVMGKIGKALNTMNKATHYQEVMSGGVATFMKNMVKGASNKSVFIGAIGTAAVAASLYAVMGAHKGNREASQALQDFKNDVANDHHPLVEAAKSPVLRQTAGRGVGAVLESGGQFMMMGGEILPAMAVQVGAMSAQGVLVGENAIVDAHHQLKLNEKKKALSAEQEIDCWRKIVGELPAMKKDNRGGYYNHMAAPVAKALVEKGLPVRETMRLIADTAKFDAFLKEVHSKLETEAKAIAANENKATETHAAESHKAISAVKDTHAAGEAPMSPKQAAEAAYHAAEKPGTHAVMGEHAEAQGKVAAQHLQVANGSHH